MPVGCDMSNDAICPAGCGGFISHHKAKLYIAIEDYIAFAKYIARAKQAYRRKLIASITTVKNKTEKK